MYIYSGFTSIFLLKMLIFQFVILVITRLGFRVSSSGHILAVKHPLICSRSSSRCVEDSVVALLGSKDPDISDIFDLEFTKNPGIHKEKVVEITSRTVLFIGIHE